MVAEQVDAGERCGHIEEDGQQHAEHERERRVEEPERRVVGVELERVFEEQIRARECEHRQQHEHSPELLRRKHVDETLAAAVADCESRQRWRRRLLEVEFQGVLLLPLLSLRFQMTDDGNRYRLLC